jgi:hypothetical protein
LVDDLSLDAGDLSNPDGVIHEIFRLLLVRRFAA